nr:MAG TPA: hypothetical protein [Caudoviricetes sp.]
MKTRDILTYHYIEIRYFYGKNQLSRNPKAKTVKV